MGNIALGACREGKYSMRRTSVTGVLTGLLYAVSA